MSEKKLINTESYPIKPEHINIGDHFFEAFGNYQMEIAACWIVSFCRARGSWQEFSITSLRDFCSKNGFETFGTIRPPHMFPMRLQDR